MTSKEFDAHFRSGDYADKKARVLWRAGGRCQQCNAPTVHCHHRSFHTFAKPDEEDDMTALCLECLASVNIWLRARALGVVVDGE